MYVWLIRDLEPIPSDPGDRRLMRAGMLASALAAAGHETVWFTSSFDHYQKRQRADRDQTLAAGPNLMIEVFRGPGYSRNVSLRRIRHNRSFAAHWRVFAEAAVRKPDVLVTDLPTTETAAAVVAFGRAHSIPTVLSIRDLWPDFFVDYLPAPLRPFARPFVWPLAQQARRATRGATSLIGVSPGYLDWGRRKGGRPPSARDLVFPLAYAARPRPTDAEVAAYLDRLGAHGRRVVSFVGSWGVTYDLDLVLATAEQLVGRSDIVFAVSGDSETRPSLAAQFARLPNVILPGWLGGDDIARLISGSAIGLLPYGSAAPQGLPNKVFEYMAYGAYQLATLTGEVGDFYRETGAGEVVAATPEALADAIVASSSEAGRADRISRFEQTYSAAIVYPQMVEHIARIAALV